MWRADVIFVVLKGLVSTNMYDMGGRCKICCFKGAGVHKLARYVEACVICAD